MTTAMLTQETTQKIEALEQQLMALEAILRYGNQEAAFALASELHALAESIRLEICHRRLLQAI